MSIFMPFFRPIDTSPTMSQPPRRSAYICLVHPDGLQSLALTFHDPAALGASSSARRPVVVHLGPDGRSWRGTHVDVPAADGPRENVVHATLTTTPETPRTVTETTRTVTSLEPFLAWLQRPCPPSLRSLRAARPEDLDRRAQVLDICRLLRLYMTVLTLVAVAVPLVLAGLRLVWSVLRALPVPTLPLLLPLPTLPSWTCIIPHLV